MMTRTLFAIFLCLSGPALAQRMEANPQKPKIPGNQIDPRTGARPPGSGGATQGGSDSCATPVAIAGQGLFPYDTTGATTGAEGQAECGAIRNDEWFDWTADATGVATVSTCGNAAYDTKLAAYPSGGCPANGTSLACNDDSCGLQSTITFPVTSGTVYLLQAGAFSEGQVGPSGLTITISGAAGNDDCVTPDIIAGQGIFGFDSTAATTGAEGQNETNCFAFSTTGIDKDLWYEWTADETGIARVQTCGLAGHDTKIAVWPGTGCPVDGTSLACSDDDCGLQSAIEFNVTNGSTYTLQVGSFPGASGGTGSFEIQIGPPPWDRGIVDVRAVPLADGRYIFDADLRFSIDPSITSNLNLSLFVEADIASPDPLPSFPIYVEAVGHGGGSCSAPECLPNFCGGLFLEASSTTMSCEPWTHPPDCSCDGGVWIRLSWPSAFTISAGDLVRFGIHPEAAALPELDDQNDTLEFRFPGENFCTANPNSTGMPAHILAVGSTSAADGNLRLYASPVPNQPGIFFHGANATQFAFGNSFMCVAGDLKRGAVVSATGNVATYLFRANQLGRGARNFQFWFRDPMGGGAQFSTSDGIAIDILP